MSMLGTRRARGDDTLYILPCPGVDWLDALTVDGFDCLDLRLDLPDGEECGTG